MRKARRARRRIVRSVVVEESIASLKIRLLVDQNEGGEREVSFDCLLLVFTECYEAV